MISGVFMEWFWSGSARLKGDGNASVYPLCVHPAIAMFFEGLILFVITTLPMELRHLRHFTAVCCAWKHPARGPLSFTSPSRQARDLEAPVGRGQSDRRSVKRRMDVSLPSDDCASGERPDPIGLPGS
jgi:hypothetical protein